MSAILYAKFIVDTVNVSYSFWMLSQMQQVTSSIQVLTENWLSHAKKKENL